MIDLVSLVIRGDPCLIPIRFVPNLNILELACNVSDVARRKNLIQTSIPGIIPGTDTGKDLEKDFPRFSCWQCAVKKIYLPDVEDPFWFFFHFSTFLLQYLVNDIPYLTTTRKPPSKPP